VQSRLARGHDAAAADLEYGSHPRQRLDLYAPADPESASLPVLLWVHGGGFLRGEKSSPDHPFNAHVGRWAARNGFLGAVMNYRLAPEFTWPAGGEDVGRAVDWLRLHATGYGGDSNRLVLAGTSAGAVHIGTYLQLRPGVKEVQGAILMSGLYGVTPMIGPDMAYFGPDQSVYARQACLEAIAKSPIPLFVACAEFDPPRFQAETLALLEAALNARGSMPRAHFASGHNHYTLAMHLGTEDKRLSNEMLSFAHECCGNRINEE
jgi:acetyl esterase/lipase